MQAKLKMLAETKIILGKSPKLFGKSKNSKNKMTWIYKLIGLI